VALKIEEKLWKKIRRLGMSDADWDRLHDRLKSIAADPFGQHPYAKRRADGSFQVRHGNWRALYEIDKSGDVEVIDVGNRGDINR
jgi:mRNA-degrading endonuclease RelE of RelBE toxin-antitoxin system